MIYRGPALGCASMSIPLVTQTCVTFWGYLTMHSIQCLQQRFSTWVYPKDRIPHSIRWRQSPKSPQDPIISPCTPPAKPWFPGGSFRLGLGEWDYNSLYIYIYNTPSMENHTFIPDVPWKCAFIGISQLAIFHCRRVHIYIYIDR